MRPDGSRRLRVGVVLTAGKSSGKLGRQSLTEIKGTVGSFNEAASAYYDLYFFKYKWVLLVENIRADV